jgi:CheY-like chemotaxis protein
LKECEFRFNFGSPREQLNTLKNGNVNTLSRPAPNRITHITVVGATNGKDALALFSAYENFDMILTDLRMPIMDGFETTRQIRQYEKKHQIEKRIPIVAITADLTEEVVKQCQIVGIDDIVAKPIDFNKLITTVSNYLLQPTESNPTE